MKKGIKEMLIRRQILQKKKIQAQFECLREAFIDKKRQMSVKEMSDYLKSKNFTKGVSTKMIYRQILPKLEEISVYKGYYKYYFQNKISRKEILSSIKIISDFVKKESNSKKQEQIDKFLKYVKSGIEENKKEYFFY